MNQLPLDITDYLDEIRVFLPKLIRACDSTGDLFYTPLNAEALDIIQQVVEGVNSLLQMIDVTVNSLYKAFTVWEKPLHAAAANLRQSMTEIDYHFKENKFIAAGDLFKYEITIICQNLLATLGEAKTGTGIKNQIVFFENFPDLYKQFENTVQSPDQYQIVYSRIGLPNLFVDTVDVDPSYFYSKYDPDYEASCWVESISDLMVNKKAALIWGLGFGYHLNAFLQQYPHTDIYIYEPNEQVLMAALQVTDFQELRRNRRIHLFLAGEDKNTIKQLASHLYYLKHDMAVLELPIYKHIFRNQKERILNSINIEMEEIVITENTMKRYQDILLENILKNFTVILKSPSLMELKDSLSDYSAVIVGAGPSLDQDIEKLRELRKHAFIIAAGTAVQALQLHGIEPHLIVTMDGYVGNYSAFQGINANSIPFLFFPPTHYRIIEEKNASFIHAFFHYDPLSSYLMDLSNEDPVFFPTHSVTGSAIQAAIYMGCKEIIFAGQDLSYSNNKFYAAGSKHVEGEVQQSRVEQASETVENVMGGFNRTDSKMRVTLLDIEELIENYPNTKFTNTTGMGAKIKAAPFESIEETISRLEATKVPETLLKDVYSTLQGYDQERVKQVLKRMDIIPNELSMVNTLLKSISKRLNQLGVLKLTSQKKCKIEMERIETDWARIVSTSVFNSIYLRSLSSQVLEFDHTRPRLEKETNVVRKADLFVDVLGKLVNEMIKNSDYFQRQVNDAFDYWRGKGLVLTTLR